MTDVKKYNPTLAPLYKTAKGYWSSMLSPTNVATAKEIEEGGKYSVTLLDEKTREERVEKAIAAGKAPRTVPYGFIEFIPAARVKELDAMFEITRSTTPNPNKKEI